MKRFALFLLCSFGIMSGMTAIHNIHIRCRDGFVIVPAYIMPGLTTGTTLDLLEYDRAEVEFIKDFLMTDHAYLFKKNKDFTPFMQRINRFSIHALQRIYTLLSHYGHSLLHEDILNAILNHKDVLDAIENDTIINLEISNNVVLAQLEKYMHHHGKARGLCCMHTLQGLLQLPDASISPVKNDLCLTIDNDEADSQFNVFLHDALEEPISNISCGNFVNNAHYNNTGRRIIISLQHGSIHVCHLRTNISEVIYHTEEISDAIISPCGKYVMAIAQTSILVWNMENKETPFIQIGYNEDEDDVKQIFFSPDSRYCGVTIEGKPARLFSTATGACEFVFEHAPGVDRVVFNNAGTHAYTLAYNNDIKIWDMATRSCNCVLAHDAEVNDMRISPCGNRLVTGLRNNKIYIWNLSTRTCEHSAELSDCIQSVDWTPCGKYLLIGCEFTLSLYSLVTKSVVASHKYASAPRHVFVSDTGKYAFVVLFDNSVHMMSLPKLPDVPLSYKQMLFVVWLVNQDPTSPVVIRSEHLQELYRSLPWQLKAYLFKVLGYTTTFDNNPSAKRHHSA